MLRSHAFPVMLSIERKIAASQGFDLNVSIARVSESVTQEMITVTL